MVRRTTTSNTMPLTEMRDPDGQHIRYRTGAGQYAFGAFWTAFSSIFLLLGISGMTGSVTQGWSSASAPTIFALVGGLFVLIGVLILVSYVELNLDLSAKTYTLTSGTRFSPRTRTGTFQDIANLRITSAAGASRTASMSVMLDWKTDAPSLCIKSFRKDPLGAQRYVADLSKALGLQGVTDVAESTEPLHLSESPPDGLKLEKYAGYERLVLPPSVRSNSLVFGASALLFVIMGFIAVYSVTKNPVVLIFGGITALHMLRFVFLKLKSARTEGMPRVLEARDGKVRCFAEGPQGEINLGGGLPSLLSKLSDSPITNGELQTANQVTSRFPILGVAVDGLTFDQAIWASRWMRETQTRSVVP